MESVDSCTESVRARNLLRKCLRARRKIALCRHGFHDIHGAGKDIRGEISRIRRRGKELRRGGIDIRRQNLDLRRRFDDRRGRD